MCSHRNGTRPTLPPPPLQARAVQRLRRPWPRRVFSLHLAHYPGAAVVWRELEAGRARNVRVRRRNASRYSELAHDFSFCIAVYGKGAAVHKFVANTLFGLLPSRQHTLHQRLKGAAVLHEVGYLESRFAAAR